MADFSQQVLTWFDSHGRHDLPWQVEPSPYRVWVSEVMLQQTQVSTVIPYFQRFMERFPDVEALAVADIDLVLHLWTGLGYYARARNLHHAANILVADFDARFPADITKLETLPGIGRSTAGAIAALSMDIRAPILDGNVKRVLTRYFAIGGWPEQTTVRKRLWEVADRLTPANRVADYTQAMMDLGATVCRRSRPDCDRCPLQADCRAFNTDCIADFPGRRPKQTLPVKAVKMFIIHNGEGAILLEKRPASGIWGGLYSLPEAPVAEQGQKAEAGWVLQSGPALLIDPRGRRELPAFRHSFTHYHLDIEPVIIIKWELQQGVAETDSWLWYPLDQSKEVGLSAPVKKLLGSLPAQMRKKRNKHDPHGPLQEI